MHDHWTEARLLEGCRRGERAAQHQLYIQTSGRIYGVLLKITRDPERAFDLAQETYLKAFSRIAQFNGRSSLATWLYRIAVNEALYTQRQTAIAEGAKVGLAAAASMNGSEHSAVSRLDVAEALARLSEADRAILVLRYQEGLDYAAISEITGLADGTIASRLNRARQRLRALLNGYSNWEEAGPVAHPTFQERTSLRSEASQGAFSHLTTRAAKP